MVGNTTERLKKKKHDEVPYLKSRGALRVMFEVVSQETFFRRNYSKAIPLGGGEKNTF